MKKRYIDIGLNLASSKFTNDWEEVLSRASTTGVERFILTGTTVESSEISKRLVSRLPLDTAYFTTGIHPHYAKSFTGDTFKRMQSLLDHPLAVAVGETGLDYFRNISSKDEQQHSFRQHIDLACKLRKPLFLHERDAHEDFLQILDEHSSTLPPCVVHCFTGTERQAIEYVERGFYIGITGWIGQKKRNADLLKALLHIPDDRLMLETDAPYLAPDTYRGSVRGRNEPDAMPQIADFVARAKKVDVDTLSEQIYSNTKRFFGLL